MARFSRGLGLVLTACMAVTRPSSAIRAGSSDSGPWWTKNFTTLIQTAKARREAGDIAGLESVYAQGYERARVLGILPAQLSYLNNLGTVRMLSLRYAPALKAYLEAAALAERLGDWQALGGIAVNLSRIYQELGDADGALSALERGKAATDRLPATPFYQAQLLMNLRSIRSALQSGPGVGDGTPRYEDAIEAARQAGDASGEAAAWDLLGQEKIAAGDLDGAEACLGQALRLRSSVSPTTVGFSYAALGALRLAQAGRASGPERRRRAIGAMEFTERALLGNEHPGPARFVLLHQRGRIQTLLGNRGLALRDFGASLGEAERQYGSVPPALSLVNGANVTMQRQIYESFIEAAANEALRSGNQDRVAESFLALEQNRAASLRQSRELAPIWKTKLPDEYWETLALLDQETLHDLSTSSTVSPATKRLRLKLTEMESVAGVGVSVMLTENFRYRSSLSHFQQGLGDADLLLSFYLGTQESYLWAVTRRSIKLHRLPRESVIGEEVTRFREAIRSNAAGTGLAEELGADLYRRLFGSLDAGDAAKTSWLFSLDGTLFDLPLAALVTGYDGGRPVYAAERHSSQQIPGALFRSSGTPPGGGYLGVADPVYNAADPRHGRVRGAVWTWPMRVLAASRGPGELNRLVSSAREVRRSSGTWAGSDGAAARPVQVLEGTAAQRGAFLEGLRAAPSTIHLATHVLSPMGSSGLAFVAFSLDETGRPGLLSTTEIGLLQVPGALVVMTGCATATGDARAGAGLLGLTRAWLMAGARAVVATNWPVPDADGDLIPGFYSHLRGNSAAEALRRSQVEQIHSGTWQASPSYWAAFQVVGGDR